MTDEHLIRDAVARANPNALRMALIQATDDPVLARMQVTRKPVRAGVLHAASLSPTDAAIVREHARRYLLGEASTLPAPSQERARALMELMTGESLTDPFFRLGYEELGFEDAPRVVNWQGGERPASADDVSVVIIGAGIGGIGIGIALEQIGVSYTIFDRQPELGGVWASNVYPDVRVDTNSYLYQFSFERSYPWSEYYASGPETRRFLRHIAHKYGLEPHIRLAHEVMVAEWREELKKWRLTVRAANGAKEVLGANFVVSACGLFGIPKMPTIEGLESFGGTLIHTARWDDNFSPSGLRVGLIGSGSTGTQLLPFLEREASRVTVFQRTANWIAPVDGYRAEVSVADQWLFSNLPYYWNWFRYSLFLANCGFQDAEDRDPNWIAAGGCVSEANDRVRAASIEYVRSKLGHDKRLFEACIPTHAPLGRRPVVDNGWYDALASPTVDLVTTAIDHVDSTAVVTADGNRHKLDALIVAAGFETERYLSPCEYHGRGGIALDDLWAKDGPRSYLSLTLPGFPNLFTIFGPNGGPRAGGYYTMVELWSRYISRLIVQTVEGQHRVVEVRRDVFDRYNREMDDALAGLIFNSDAAGGYHVNSDGRVIVKMPWRIEEYYQRIAEPNPADYSFE